MASVSDRIFASLFPDPLSLISTPHSETTQDSQNTTDNKGTGPQQSTDLVVENQSHTGQGPLIKPNNKGQDPPNISNNKLLKL